jgi:hypothetical protein
MTFGNMGFPEAICTKDILSEKEQQHATVWTKCQGTTVIDSVISSGIYLFDPQRSRESLNICQVRQEVEFRPQFEIMSYFD